MKSEDLITPAELKALLTTEEKERFRLDAAKQEAGAALEWVESPPAYGHAVLEELKEHMLALTYRVEELERQLLLQTADKEHGDLLAAISNVPEAPKVPEPGTFSRTESYRKNNKKKKTFFQRWFD
ncbi:hypothetical protein [Paenibacillus eucommiae]|uniref:Uncharacterized protein n=1 Tax=Paenibacillus eucommiae TaxID=1355755 RepID=A0ABS4J590_9BACL|nr:hypothetical protein [Paenibacillus eucommiae]MBP1995016.1 hypothetical protein [Paenibacillus eucommiae]